MIKIKKNFIRLILEHYHLYASKSIRIPTKWVQLLQIHYSLINLSYIFNNSPTSWISFFVILIRPAEALQLDYFQYIGVIFLIFHLFYLVFPNFRGSSICSLINDLLKISLLNFCFEQFQDILGNIVGILLLIFQFFEQLFINWTLNIEIRNFQQVNITTLKVVKLLLDIILLVGHKTQLNYLIIQYLAIFNSIVYAMQIYEEKFHKDYICKIIIGIQMITIYLGIVQFIKFENSYSLIVAPFFFRIAQKIHFESQFNEQKDQIIISSIKLKERCYLDCFKLLFSKKENNLLRDIKKQLIQQKCVEQFTCDLYKKNKIITFEGLAQQLQKSDMKKQKILELLESLIQYKINIFENWNKSHLSDLLILIQMIDETKQYLAMFYNKQPYGAAKSASVYFYSEILNDIIETNEIITHTKKSLEISSKFQQNLSQVCYIQFNFLNNQLTINKTSSNTPKKYITDQLSDLIPQGIQSYHEELIQNFIQTGQCKFAKSFNRNYINNDGFVESINFALDLLYNNQIQFYSVLQPQQKQVDEYLIICDENHIIKSISKSINENFTLHSIFKVGNKINEVIKQIDEIDSNCTIDSFRYFFQPIQTSRKSFLFIDISEQVMNYFCDVIIEKKFIHKQLAYEIIELINFRNYISFNQDSLAQSKQSKSKLSYVELETLNEIPKDEIVIPPYELFSEMPKNEVDHIFTSRDEEQIMLQFNNNNNEYQKSFRSLRLFKTQIKDESHNKKVKLDTQNDLMQLDSLSSSVQFVIQSKFWKKYSIINRFYKHKPLKNQQQFIISIFGLAIFIQIILILIQLSTLNLVQFATDIDLLEIKSLFFQPLDQFLATRWNLWTYNYQKSQSIITQAQYDEYSQFSISLLGRGYDTLNQNIQQVLDKTQLQDILQTKEIQAFQQTNTYTYDLYNVNLRSAIQILLNFQYILKMNYVYEKTVKADSPQIFYSFKNYPILRDIIDQLNQDIMTATLLRGERYQNQLNFIFICQQVFLFLITASILFLKIRISKKLQVYFTILKFINQTSLEKEINKLKLILNKISYLPEQIFNFQFKLYQKESQFFSKKTDLNPQNFHKFQKKYKISQKASIFFLISFYCFIQLNCLFNYLEYITYLKKYPQTASYKKQLSDLSGDIPLMFAQREVLYGRKNYIYLDENYFNTIFQYIQQSLNQTKEFTASNPNFSNMLMSDEFTNYYQKLQTNNLCLNLPEYLVNKSQILCPITMNGNMRQGLKAMLIYISNLISTDMSINNFVQREKPTQNELEGAYMLSEIILMLNKNFYNDLIEITTKLIQQIIIFNSLFIFGLVIVFILIIIVVQNKMLKNSGKLLGLLYLIPEQILFNDEALERNLRILINI